MRKYLLSILLVLCIVYPIQARMSRMPNQKPIHGSQIDWTHPLVPDYCWLMNEYTGQLLSDLSGYNNNFDDWTNNPSWVADGINFDQSLSQYITCNYPKALFSGFIPYTIFIGLNIKSLPYSAGIFTFGKYNPTWAINTSKQIYVYHAGGLTPSTLTVPLNIHSTIAYTRNNGIALRYYINGVFSNVVNQSQGIDVPSTITIACDRDGNGNEFDGIIEFVYVWNRELTAFEIKQLHEDNYCFIKKPQNMALRWFGNTSGAPPEPGGVRGGAARGVLYLN